MSPMACLRAIRVRLMEQGRETPTEIHGADAAVGISIYEKFGTCDQLGLYDQSNAVPQNRK